MTNVLIRDVALPSHGIAVSCCR